MIMRKRVIQFLVQYRFFNWLLPIFHVIIGRCSFQMGKGNILDSNTANIYKTIFKISEGTDNKIIIGENSDCHNSRIIIKGNGNKIKIGADVFINGMMLIIEGDNNSVIIGDNAFIMGDTRIYVVDGTTFSMGDNCMFSDHIEIRTTDNHSIIDRMTGKRINYEEDVILHNKVWIGTGVKILKGSELAEGCIVGAGGVITRKHMQPYTIIAGNPGKEIKYNVDWKMERIYD